ncbi:PorT family protein [Cyclobacteriaceae bacterium]|nr:PorT family protein [Cyclobacteriaceae bacterium]
MGGWNFSDVRLEGSEYGSSGSEDASGFYAGILAEGRIVPLLFLQTGLKYNKNGFKSGQDRVVLNYLTVPIAAKLKLGPIYALGGLYGAYRMGSKVKHDNGSDTKIDNDKINRWDWGLNAGLGVQIAMIGIEARYNFGMQDIYSGVGSINNRYLELGATLRIR